MKFGTARVKITDETNNYSTYLLVEVIENVTKSQIKTGSNFTVALKENGTVWEYGAKVTNEPKKVQGLKDITDIGAGNGICIAVDESGKVYTWNARKLYCKRRKFYFTSYKCRCI
ncbi:MAG: hypothetical protein K2H53_05465 [Clostridia bacterium]|nr:hypothetical protein [Clostridia bacterium]